MHIYYCKYSYHIAACIIILFHEHGHTESISEAKVVFSTELLDGNFECHNVINSTHAYTRQAHYDEKCVYNIDNQFRHFDNHLET